MRQRRLAVVATMLLLAGCASGLKERAAAVRVTQDRSDVRGCQLVGVVTDEAIDDLQEKTAKRGGDTALIVGIGSESRPSPLGWPFGGSSVGLMTAQAYRCVR